MNRTEDIEKIKNMAFLYRGKYRGGLISREEAEKWIIPYLNYINRVGMEKSKKYSIKFSKVRFESFVR